MSDDLSKSARSTRARGAVAAAAAAFIDTAAAAAKGALAAAARRFWGILRRSKQKRRVSIHDPSTNIKADRFFHELKN